MTFKRNNLLKIKRARCLPHVLLNNPIAYVLRLSVIMAHTEDPEHHNHEMLQQLIALEAEHVEFKSELHRFSNPSVIAGLQKGSVTYLGDQAGVMVSHLPRLVDCVRDHALLFIWF